MNATAEFEKSARVIASWARPGTFDVEVFSTPAHGFPKVHAAYKQFATREAAEAFAAKTTNWRW